MTGFQQATLSGSMLLAIPVALLAGLVSFFSPCVIPLLPGYLSYATGLSGAEVVSGQARRSRLLLGALLFVLGFAVVFVALGVVSAQVMIALEAHRRTLNVVLGALCVGLGLVFLGAFGWAQRDVRVHRVPAVGLAAAPVLGALFGIGWTPCLGPTLGAVLTLAATQGTVARGGVLLAVYSLGLGLPFLLAAAAWRRAMRVVGAVRRHQRAVTRVGGLLLVVVGVLLLTGLWDHATQWLQVRLVDGYEVGV